MNLNVADIFFAKHDIIIFEDVFNRLVAQHHLHEHDTITRQYKDKVVHSNVMMQLINYLRLSKESQSLVSVCP